jgi:hypothetical protein
MKSNSSGLFVFLLIASILVSAVPYKSLIGSTENTKNFGWMKNSYWFEGTAEINFYDAKISKYGIPREANELVHILVTEKHKPDQLVKADNWRESGLVDMLKFNYVRSFQTGIYSYREMMSVFFDQNQLQLTKLTFSSQDWCGQSFKELVNFNQKSSYNYNTYWDGQGSGLFDISFPEDLYVYDALPVQLRMFNLTEKRKFEIHLLPTQKSSKVIFPRTEKAFVQIFNSEEVSVPAGKYNCYLVTVSHSAGKDSYWLEAQFPHRLIKWVAFNEDRHELIDSKKLPYWELNQPGGEKYLPRN